MSSRKQFKGTKMSLTQFADSYPVNSSKIEKKFPTIKQSVERAPIVSLTEIIKDEEKTKINNFVDNKKFSSDRLSDENISKPQDKSHTKKHGRANFKNGTKLELDNIYIERVSPDESCEESENFLYRTLMESKYREIEERKEQRKQNAAIRKKLDDIEEEKWQQRIKDQNFVYGQLSNMSYDFYKQLVEARKRSINNTRWHDFGEMRAYLIQAPNIIRNGMINKILNYGIKIVSEVNGLELTLRMDSKGSTWKSIMDINNAYFKMSKNDKHVFCDVRTTFIGAEVMEIEIFRIKSDDEFDGPVSMIDMAEAADFINNMLS